MAQSKVSDMLNTIHYTTKHWEQTIYSNSKKKEFIISNAFIVL